MYVVVISWVGAVGVSGCDVWDLNECDDELKNDALRVWAACFYIFF